MTYYLSLFDGSKKSFGEVERVFNYLFHEDCIITDSDGNTRNREDLKQNHAEKLALSSKCTLLLFRVVTYDIIEIKYRLVNDEEDKIIHQILTTNGDNRVVKARVTIEDSSEKDSSICKKLITSRLPSPKNKRDTLEGEEEEKTNTKRMKVEV